MYDVIVCVCLDGVAMAVILKVFVVVPQQHITITTPATSQMDGFNMLASAPPALRTYLGNTDGTLVAINK